ncbi:AraC family transcriptional regulator [Cupriavidus basilensis]|uniref:AraC family transcriptional regulator n=1 Tax=Cupriavidus basilensis TaxID=68895 RepID=A0ABT6AJB2_9BURK|nr:AraC family transcriptional regulator [Cupriavidus basilensis]MDF3832680.1 AraC family transcriptional regulator [Cupriavidus basilensis]
MNHTDRVVHWVLSSLELETTLFHIGQYCGTWRASVAGRMRAGFHLVLHGACWLHLPGEQRRSYLQAGDAVFFLRDVPHYLGQHDDPQACLPVAGMQPLDLSVADATGLACGFFDFRPGFSEVLLAPFPDYLVLPAGTAALGGTRALFDLILAEARRGDAEPSPLIARLVDLLFFYVVRHLAAREDVAQGLWPLLRSAEFSGLMLALIQHPERPWSVETMAELVHMSRATFSKRFTEACGQPPAAFLLLLRMKIASQLLAGRCSIAQAAERVGYRSEAAFARAFKKATGAQPGAYRRQGQRAPATGAAFAPT